ncbi:CotH kinase family protein [Rudanella lutea]|uniref:CotH kinase family protein n=1 Tax=Rudanella lutea TaxID=451374 RepID=UPI00036A6F78|nr:CotH kinase family protein [Rudanella lutea]
MNSFRYLTLCLIVGATVSCKTPDELTPSGNSASSNPDWTEASHGKSAEPNYAVVFPQDKVNTLEITMTAAEWQSIQADMTTKFGGAFGAGGTTAGAGGGGMPPGGGAPGAGGAGQFGTADPAYIALPVRFNGKLYEKVGFRLKGNSSLSSSWRTGVYKLPFRLKMDHFEDTNPEVKDQRLYGFKELSMSPGYSDNSLIREKVVADVFRMAGIPAARTAFYKVYIDFGAGKKYCGVYTMVEVIDDTMVENQFGEDKGNIYKPESTFQTFLATQFEKKNNETAADYTDVQAFVTALNATNRTTDAATWRTNLEKTFNVDHYLKFLAVNNTIVNWDTYGAIAHNYYLYNAPTKKLTWIPWDHNMSMTNTVGGGAAPGGGAQPGGGAGGGRSAVSLAMTEVGTGWPLLRFVAADPVYYARYKEYVRQFAQSVFTPANMNTLFDKYHTLIMPYVTGTETEQKPYSHLASAASFTSALTEIKAHVVSRNQAVVEFLK